MSAGNRDENGGRDPSTGRFLPGNASTGGRRGYSDEDRAALDELTPEAWRRLRELLGSRDGNVAMKAVQVVLDRRFGKAPQAPEDNDAMERAWDSMLERLRMSEPPG